MAVGGLLCSGVTPATRISLRRLRDPNTNSWELSEVAAGKVQSSEPRPSRLLCFPSFLPLQGDLMLGWVENSEMNKEIDAWFFPSREDLRSLFFFLCTFLSTWGKTPSLDHLLSLGAQN